MLYRTVNFEKEKKKLREKTKLQSTVLNKFSIDIIVLASMVIMDAIFYSRRGQGTMVYVKIEINCRALLSIPGKIMILFKDCNGITF